jgi:hypothetical protein
MNTLEHGGMASLHLDHDGVLGPGCFKYDTIRDDSNLVMTFFESIQISAAQIGEIPYNNDIPP